MTAEPATKDDIKNLADLIKTRMDAMAENIGEIKDATAQNSSTVHGLCEWRAGVEKDLAYLKERTTPPSPPASLPTPPAPTPRQKREPGPGRLTVREFLLLAFGIAIVASGATAAILKVLTLLVR